MTSALQVLNGKLYAYQRGETSLLEVLTAQHTYNELQKDYATSVYDCMVALVELERSVGR
jgi:Outer membrane protein